MPFPRRLLVSMLLSTLWACAAGSAADPEPGEGGQAGAGGEAGGGGAGAGGAGGGTGGAGGGPGGSGGADGTCASSDDCSADPTAPYCEPSSGRCGPPPAGGAIGWGDGSPGSVRLETIFAGPELVDPSDLAFNPAVPDQLWIVNKGDDSVVILGRFGSPEMFVTPRRDPAASHFMARPPALAFGAVTESWGQTFGVCGDGDNGNGFMGPALFSAEPTVFADETPLGLGSHLDMLHSTTFCRGIAHVAGNAYFVFNGALGALDLYDFKEDHGPGNDDHSDGEIYRYVEGEVAGVEGVSSHLAYDRASGYLYVADTGHGRIARLDASSGTAGAVFGGMEPVEVRVEMEGALLDELVPPGTIDRPSGLELRDGVLYASDAATSRFHAFDLEGRLLRSLELDLPAGSLGGFTFDADGRIVFLDRVAEAVVRIEP